MSKVSYGDFENQEIKLSKGDLSLPKLEVIKQSYLCELETISYNTPSTSEKKATYLGKRRNAICEELIDLTPGKRSRFHGKRRNGICYEQGFQLLGLDNYSNPNQAVNNPICEQNESKQNLTLD